MQRIYSQLSINISICTLSKLGRLQVVIWQRVPGTPSTTNLLITATQGLTRLTSLRIVSPGRDLAKLLSWAAWQVGLAWPARLPGLEVAGPVCQGWKVGIKASQEPCPGLSPVCRQGGSGGCRLSERARGATSSGMGCVQRLKYFTQSWKLALSRDFLRRSKGKCFLQKMDLKF